MENSNNLQTFGEFLTFMTNKRDLTMTELQNRLGLKSRTMIYRIMQEEVKYSTILEMKDDIVTALELTHSELEDTKTALRVSELGKETIFTQNKILQFIKNLKDKPVPDTDFKKIVSFSGFAFDSIESVLDTFKNADELEMYIINCVSKEFMYKLSRFTTQNSKNIKKLTIEHVLQMDSKPSHNIDILDCIVELLSFTYYNAFYNPNINVSANNNFSFLSDIVIIKHKQDNTESVHMLKLDTMDKIINHYCSNDTNMLNFYLSTFLNIKNDCRLLTVTFDNDNFIDNLCNISNYFYECERNNIDYFIKPNFCYSVIPPDLLNKLVHSSPHLEPVIKSDTANSFFSLLNNLKYRHNNLLNKQNKSVEILSIEGINQLIASCKLSDHINGLRAFSYLELKELFVFLKALHISPKCSFQFYILRTNIISYDCMIYFSKNKALSIDNYKQKYNNDYKPSIITTPLILECFDSFFENVLLKDYVMSEEESIKFIDSKIAELDVLIAKEEIKA